MIHDEKNRMILWIPEAKKPDKASVKLCFKAKTHEEDEAKYLEKLKIYEDNKCVRKLDALDEALFRNLAVKERAIRNWKRIRLPLVLLLHCGKRVAGRADSQQERKCNLSKQDGLPNNKAENDD